MSIKKLRRLIGTIAIAGVCAIVPAISGCSTDHPEAKITVSFNGKEYVLSYKLYRNMYPQTVQHFIELADNGFYTNTLIHNYTSSTWYGGGYNYVTEAKDDDGGILTDEDGEPVNAYTTAYSEGVEAFREYLESVTKEREYETLADPLAGKITPTVYKDFINGQYNQPLNTLIGEFKNNQHNIDNGALKSSFGCLRMYYTSKSMDSAKNVKVYLDKQGSEKGVMGNYTYNSATSLFSIQQNSTVSTDSSYCIFGVLQDEQVLRDLRSAVSTYSAKVGSSKFSLDVNLYVDNRDEFVGANVNEVSYRATSEPIIIKSVKITKY